MAIISFLSISILVFLLPAEKLIRKTSNLSYRYRSQYRRGKDLLIDLSQLNLMGDLTHLSHYKFFDELICEISQVAKEFGAATSKTLSKLRHSLSTDLQIEKKSSGVMNESYFQFLLAACLTLFLNIFSTKILDFEIDTLFISCALAYNLIGIITFHYLIKKLAQKQIVPIGHVLHSFLIFKLMYDVGTPLNQLISSSRINSLVDIQLSYAKELFRRLTALVEMKQAQGLDIGDDLESIEIGLWDEYKSQNEQLLSRIKICKFIWLVVFFFIPYVGNFFRLISHLNL
ncbi:hypothetical protein [Halobacteriovorax sp. DPLXC-1]|uniref:hypothetical protein n=1 Tax=Halobacteriovorax sp. DPLXC-1 TaxID=3110771 RepID=UPI002FEFDB30